MVENQGSTRFCSNRNMGKLVKKYESYFATKATLTKNTKKHEWPYSVQICTLRTGKSFATTSCLPKISARSSGQAKRREGHLRK